jgi:hypothetical protein
MFASMVVLLLFHLQGVENADFECSYDEILMKFCCTFESDENYCERLQEEFQLKRNTTLSDEFYQKTCCQKVQATDEFNYEVNDLN